MNELSRRAFLQRLGYLTAAGVANPMTINLMGMAEAAAQTATDYKALVCVFFEGGNDHANTLIPVDNDNYNSYKNIRQSIALDRSKVLPLIPTSSLSGGLKWGFHPELGRLNSLFHLKKLAVLQNVGTLIQPTSIDQFKRQTVPLPDTLFSHSTQKKTWQSTPNKAFTEGWGGHIGDLILSQNSQTMFSCISTANNSLFLTGEKAIPLNIDPSGIRPIQPAKENANLYGSRTAAAALRELITSDRHNIMENYLNSVTRRSIEAEQSISSALKGAGEFVTQFPRGNSLADQLQAVAKLIKTRDNFGLKRQIFFVNLDGFDTHADLLSRHSNQMALVNDALASFYEATEEMNMTESVTTFTASDFGRTFSSNGNGSDHGWGSHHIIMGGAVNGRDFYGNSPEIGLDTAEDTGQGRLLPTTSIDQYAATLAKWFGVSNSDMRLVTPNLYNFNEQDLGFMRT
ncbi:DUF1501 domain-containing protein [uncultured Psychrobacter sp.]|uniref:DUF1501 domain-containing protein n=1 Tax=uncultured Psychrobacter sp. TaxID=259303 RepID=UPI003459DFCA